MSKADDVQERFIQFAARIINLCDTLPQTTAGTYVARQLLHSGIPPALNHVETLELATSAESIQRRRFAVRQLDESEILLRIIIASDILSLNILAPLMRECQQLQLILIGRIKTTCKPANR